uniref:Uncharacterized protein n=1 Tax=Panagrolaimus sp. PS1159 TaxID=55785 RepID=A0AC35FS00_9BILA
MKFGCSFPLLLFFGLLLPIFINADPKDCAVDGHCYPFIMGNLGGRDLEVKEEKKCDDGLCYAFRCITYDGRVMHGSGCYEDFVNTCKYIDPKIKERAKGDKDYSAAGENVFVTVCDDYQHSPPSSCAQSKEKQWFYSHAGKKFGKHLKENAKREECAYRSAPAKTKPKVQCRQGGQCITGKAYDKEITKKYQNVTCSECVIFKCDHMQKIKSSRKNYFYFDENYMMASCSYKDNCHEEKYEKYQMVIPDKFDMFNKWYTKADKICKYQPLSKPEPSKQNGNDSSKSEPLKQDENGNDANGIKISGMFIFGFILYYL